MQEKGRDFAVRTVGIGHQDFERLRMTDNFYIDKTGFIREWWERNDSVTLIARPRRFGKTLNMSMLECFFSVRYEGRGDLFQGLEIWQDEKYRNFQGTWPVISLSFASVKNVDYKTSREQICRILANLYSQYHFLYDSDCLTEQDRVFFKNVSPDMNDAQASAALYQLSDYLCRYYGKKVIILLDEYDTPMQEAYVNGYWKEMTGFIRSLFNAAFKTNSFLERAVMTGITRVSRESVFSDLNNLKVITTTSDVYQDSFGFTEKEVSAALEEYGLTEKMPLVERWYDGFTFGNMSGIYNPWSIINFLDTGKLGTYWANTSSNALVGKLIREGSAQIKQDMEELLRGGSIHTQIDEQIVFDQLDDNEPAIWSLFLASGYLKVKSYFFRESDGWESYELALTNLEVRIMFSKLIEGWFAQFTPSYSLFVKALLLGDLDAMNSYMNRVALCTFSYFDTGKEASPEPERFYHGFVLGLIVELSDRYVITSNRESGFGRYDVMMEPKREGDDAIILEFKVFNPKREKNLEETVQNALRQIEEKKYEKSLLVRGFFPERIRRYGFAFRGKEVLIGEYSNDKVVFEGLDKSGVLT